MNYDVIFLGGGPAGYVGAIRCGQLGLSAAVIEREGPERAHFLLEQLLEEARQHSIDMPFSANTG